VKKVIGYISRELEHTANSRRKNITIKDFLQRDANLNLDFINNVADSVLKEKTKKLADKLIVHKEAGLHINEIDLLSKEVKEVLSSQLEEGKDRVIEKNTLQPYYRLKDKDTMLSEKIKSDIQNAVSMSDDLEYTRAKTENQLLELMLFKTDCDAEINIKIKDWISLRIIDLKSKPEFKLLYDSEFKGQMIDRFKHEIISELGLNEYDLSTVTFETFNPIDESEKTRVKNDIANKNNLNHIMENALGYDNLLERLQDPASSSQLAQSNFFEGLLAEYYIDKRNEYKINRSMLEGLNKIFNEKTFRMQTKRKGTEINPIGSNVTYGLDDAGLSAFNSMMDITRDKPELLPEDVNKLIALGDSINIAMYGETQGISEELLQYYDKNNTWPERLPKFDIRRTPKEWVEEKLLGVVTDIFEARGKVEKELSRSELVAYDKEISPLFSKDKMIMRLLHELDREYVE